MLLATITSSEPLYRPTTTGPGASRSLPNASNDPDASAASFAAGGGCIPRRNISDLSASLAVRVSDFASAAISSSSPTSMLAYNSASRRRSSCSSIGFMIAASYPWPPGAASFVFQGWFSTSRLSYWHTLFSRISGHGSAFLEVRSTTPQPSAFSTPSRSIRMLAKK